MQPSRIEGVVPVCPDGYVIKRGVFQPKSTEIVERDPLADPHMFLRFANLNDETLPGFVDDHGLLPRSNRVTDWKLNIKFIKNCVAVWQGKLAKDDVKWTYSWGVEWDGSPRPSIDMPTVSAESDWIAVLCQDAMIDGAPKFYRFDESGYVFAIHTLPACITLQLFEAVLQQAEIGACEQCGRPMVIQRDGALRCSAVCRMRAYRSRKKKSASPAKEKTDVRKKKKARKA